MFRPLRLLAFFILAIGLTGVPVADLFAQSRGRTAGPGDEDSPARTRTEESGRSTRSSGRSDDEAPARAPQRERTPAPTPQAKAQREPARSPQSEPARTPERTRRTESARSPQRNTRNEPARTRQREAQRTSARTPQRDATSPQSGPSDRTRQSDRAGTGNVQAPDERAPERERAAPRDRSATSRDDRQRSDAGRPTRERTPVVTTPAPSPGRTVVRPPLDADGRANRGVRGRNADRSARGGRVVSPPPVVVRPVHRARVDAAWPWEWRHRHQWSPLYRYRQRVIIDAGWLGHRRNSVVEVETTYRHRLRRADHRRAEIDVYVQRIALYDRGRYLGEVDRIPAKLARTRAYVYRNGAVRFDREIFLVGNRYDGFEIISTRYYDDYILNAYDRSHGFRAGYLDLRRGRVFSIRHSRLFDPFQFDGHVPLSLLPDDRGWLLDYGRESITGYYYDSRDARGYEDDRDWNDRGWDLQGYSSSAPGDDRLERQYRREITTNNGAVIELDREELIERIDE